MKKLVIIAHLLILLGCAGTTYKEEDGKISRAVKKKTSQAEIPSHADYNKIFENRIVDGIPVEVLEIGTLNVPTGQIVVCDPLVDPRMTPLTKTVPPGKYPIKIYVAKTEKSGERYAVAKLEFSSKKADKWLLALREGEDTAELKEEDDYFGFPVDAGLGGFFDYKSGLAYNKMLDEFYKKNPNGNIYDDFFAAEFKKNAKDPNNPNDDGDWINFKIPNTDLNITMFHSGYGDGYYPAYWGMTKDNEIVSLVIDFFVLLSPGSKTLSAVGRRCVLTSTHVGMHVIY